MNECILIILGVTGDLARRKLLPAFYDLVKQKKVTKFAIIGAAHDKVTPQQYLAQARTFITDIDEKIWQQLEGNAYYQQLDFTQAKDFLGLKSLVEEVEKKQGLAGDRIVYVAAAPHFFCDITTQLGASGVVKKKKSNEKPYHRIVYEKPFGSDKKSAESINACIAKWFDESQIYRIDHYLTKELVSSIALVRFTNSIFEPLWNKNYIESVQITLSESVGIEGRGSYYDAYGVLKDVVQNHMLQLLSLVGMEEPASLTGDAIRDTKAQVLKETKIVSGIVGQYEGYKNEEGVKKDSSMPTFAFLELAVDNKRWSGVPFYFVTGKSLEKKETLIRIKFRTVVCALEQAERCEPNYLTLTVFPDSGFSLTLNAKKPGTLAGVERISMDFCQSCESVLTPEYEVIFEEVMAGEQSISVRFDEIEYAWDIIDKVTAMKLPLLTYKQGSKGPQEALTVAEKKGLWW
jgi:glucose-6-phosphate 1-dehydrogenase